MTIVIRLLIVACSILFFSLFSFAQKKGIVKIHEPKTSISETAGLKRFQNEEFLYGYVDEKDKIKIPAKYKHAKDFNTETGIAVVTIEENNEKFDLLINTNGEVIFKNEEAYGSLYYWANGLWKIRTSRPYKYGLVNIDGKTILEKKYDKIGDYNKERDRFIIDVSESILSTKTIYRGFIDKKGEVLVPSIFRETYARPDAEGIIVGPAKGYDGYIFYKLGSGLLNDKTYSYAQKFDVSGKAKIKVGVQSGYIDRSGKEFLSEIKYDKIYDTKYGYTKVSLGNKYGFINSKKEIVIPIEYDEVGMPSSGYLRVKKNNKYGFYNKTLKIVIPLIYDKAQEFKDGYSVVVKNSKYGVLNTQGEEYIPCKYQMLDNTFSSGLIGFKENNLWGFLNKTGGVAIPAKYYSAMRFYGTTSSGQKVKGGEYEIFNKTGEVTPTNFGDVDYIQVTNSKNLFIFKRGGYYGVMNKNGKVTIKNTFTKIGTPDKNGCIWVKGKYGYGLLDAGKIIIPPVMNYIKFADQGYYIVKKNNMYGLYHRLKKQVIGLVLDNLEYAENTKKYSYRQTTSGGKEIRGYGYLKRGSIDNPWTNLKSNSASISSTTVYNRKAPIYILNDTENTQIIHQRPRGYTSVNDAKTHYITSGDLLKLEFHSTGGVFLNTPGESGIEGKKNAKKVLSDDARKSGMVLLLSDEINKL